MLLRDDTAAIVMPLIGPALQVPLDDLVELVAVSGRIAADGVDEAVPPSGQMRRDTRELREIRDRLHGGRAIRSQPQT